MAFVYSDVNSFAPTVKPLVEDVQSVYQSLFNILNTRKGEKPFFPNFGIDLDEELFEVIDDVSAVEVLRQVIDGIETNDPRVIIDISNTKVEPYPDDNKYELYLVFSLQGIEEQTFTFQGSLVA